jgi:hypothetical protein
VEAGVRDRNGSIVKKLAQILIQPNQARGWLSKAALPSSLGVIVGSYCLIGAMAFVIVGNADL